MFMHPSNFPKWQFQTFDLSDLILCHLSNPFCPSPDVAQTEESVGQRLLDMEEQKKQRESELEILEEQLKQYTAKSQITDSELQYLLYICCEESKWESEWHFLSPVSLYLPFPLSASLICLFRILQRELESLRNTEHELQTLQNEVDEDTTEVIPSAV